MPRYPFALRTLCVLVISSACVFANAQDTSASNDLNTPEKSNGYFPLTSKKITDKNSVKTLDEIVVYGHRKLTDKKSITEKDFKYQPSGNMNITDYLRMDPHVRYAQSDQSALFQGEIKPEEISINGANPEQTGFFVDNVNVNNDLQMDKILDLAQVVPHYTSSQGYFFDASMLQRVEVQSSNISPALGGFLGGVVVAKTKQYSGKNRITVNYETTRSSWAKLNMNEFGDSIASMIASSDSLDGPLKFNQPHFVKNFGNFTIEQGITDNLGLVFGFSRRHSTIDQRQIVDFKENPNFDPSADRDPYHSSPSNTIGFIPVYDKHKESRQTDTAMLNLKWTPSDTNRLELGLRYANYRDEHAFSVYSKNDQADYHQGLGGTLAWVHNTNKGTWTNTLAFDQFTDEQKSGSNDNTTFQVDLPDNSSVIGITIGGYGNSKVQQKNYHYSTEFAFDTINLGKTEHSISVGAIYQQTDYDFKRDADVRMHPPVSNLTWGQPLISSPEVLKIAKAGKVNAHYFNLAGYAEDYITYKNFEFRPGLRIERDNYLKNTNIAPRFVARYSPFPSTQLSLGLNRYYGRSFASVQLTEKILELDKGETTFKRADHLKTPHTDELSFKLSQDWKNLNTTFTYNHRTYKDHIVILTSDNDDTLEPNTRKFANGDNYHVNAFTLQFSNNRPINLGPVVLNAKANVDYLLTSQFKTLPDDQAHNLVYLNGELMTAAEMEKKINTSNENWIARFELDTQIPKYDITWINRAILKAPITLLKEVDSPDAYDAYVTENYGRHFQWDTSLRWEPKVYKKHSVYIQLDVLNVLNKSRRVKQQIVDSRNFYSMYSPGRQFWLRAGFTF